MDILLTSLCNQAVLIKATTHCFLSEEHIAEDFTFAGKTYHFCITYDFCVNKKELKQPGKYTKSF